MSTAVVQAIFVDADASMYGPMPTVADQCVAASPNASPVIGKPVTCTGSRRGGLRRSLVCSNAVQCAAALLAEQVQAASAAIAVSVGCVSKPPQVYFGLAAVYDDPLELLCPTEARMVAPKPAVPSAHSPNHPVKALPSPGRVTVPAALQQSFEGAFGLRSTHDMKMSGGISMKAVVADAIAMGKRVHKTAGLTGKVAVRATVYGSRAAGMHLDANDVMPMLPLCVSEITIVYVDLNPQNDHRAMTGLAPGALARTVVYAPVRSAADVGPLSIKSFNGRLLSDRSVSVSAAGTAHPDPSALRERWAHLLLQHSRKLAPPVLPPASPIPSISSSTPLPPHAPPPSSASDSRIMSTSQVSQPRLVAGAEQVAGSQALSHSKPEGGPTPPTSARADTTSLKFALPSKPASPATAQPSASTHDQLDALFGAAAKASRAPPVQVKRKHVDTEASVGGHVDVRTPLRSSDSTSSEIAPMPLRQSASVSLEASPDPSRPLRPATPPATLSAKPPGPSIGRDEVLDSIFAATRTMKSVSPWTEGQQLVMGSAPAPIVAHQRAQTSAVAEPAASNAMPVSGREPAMRPCMEDVDKVDSTHDSDADII
jgi:hypothetical protein